MQNRGQAKPPLGVIFDCDLGHSIDDALALAILYGFDGKNEARLIAVSVSNPSLSAAAYCDAVGRFYAGPVSGAFNAAGRTLPVGMLEKGKPAETPMITVPLAKKNAEGQPLYPHGVTELNDTADPAAVLRNALTGQPDGNIVVLMAGPATGLVTMMSLPGAKDLIARKVRMLVFAGGGYPTGKVEPHVGGDIASAKRLFAEWPTPIVAVGAEVGGQVTFPYASIEKDFAWSSAHPVVEAVRAGTPQPKDIPALTPSAAMFAVRPEAGFFQRSAPGTITVDDSGATQYAASASGKHTYLTVDPAQREKLEATLVELASAKPVPRAPRQRPNQQQQQQQQKPADAAKPPIPAVQPPKP